MKKVLALVLALLMLLGGAMAEEKAAFEPAELEEGAAFEVDLDGDGTAESVKWSMVNEDTVEIVVTKASGEEVVWSLSYLYNSLVWLTDVDSNGLKEIFVSGDEASDDFFTFCLHYTGTELEQLAFPNVARGNDNSGYTNYGYGIVTAFDGNEVSLTGSQDMLGTWIATRKFSLLDGQFELVDDGYWVCESDEDNPERWIYRCLVAAQEVPVTFIENYTEVPGTLQPGERIQITRFDKIADAFFVTEDGREGYIVAPLNEESGWGRTINGVPEEEMFESIPYAD